MFIIYYSDGEWTEGSSDKDKLFYGVQSFSRTTCLTSLYSNQVECPGGFKCTGICQFITSSGYNTGLEGAYLILVTGGDTSEDIYDTAIINTIQYSVRYSANITNAPTDGEQSGDRSGSANLCMVIACIMGILFL